MEQWNAGDLTTYFCKTVTRTDLSWRSAGSTNFKALLGTVKRWLTEGGLTPVMIKAMIDAFCGDIDRWVKPGAPAWKEFIKNCTRLMYEVDKVVQKAYDDAQDDEYWGGPKDSLARRRANLIRQGS